jgi:hypothetical protein
MGLANIVAGPYNGTYDALSTTDGTGLGAVSFGKVDTGFRIRLQFTKEAVRGDLYGDTIIDNVFRGGNCHLSLVGIEYGVGLVGVFTVYSGTPGGTPTLGVIGRLGLPGVMDSGSKYAGAVVLTAVAGTTAAAAPATLTAAEGIVSEETIEILLSTQYRRVPITLQLLPYLNSVNVWFTVT